MGYIVTLGQAPNTYTGFRAASEDMEVKAGELFVESLEGWSLEAPAPLPTPQSVLAELEAWAGARSVEWLMYWATQIALLRTLFQWWGDAGNSLGKAKVLDALEALRSVQGVAQEDIDFLVEKVNSVS